MTKKILFLLFLYIFLSGDKDTYRGSDYRLSAIVLFTKMKGKCPTEFEVFYFPYIFHKYNFYYNLILKTELNFLLTGSSLHSFGDFPTSIFKSNKKISKKYPKML